MKILVAGDSVAWGQGLLEKDKFYYLAAQEISARLGVKWSDVQLRITAHSGATLTGTGNGNATPDVLFWQEVPREFPTIREQLELPAEKPIDEDVDLILLNGGINDVDFRNILNPLGNDRKLAQLIKKYLHQELAATVRQARDRYPQAKIMVLGYYPILSKRSDLNVLRLFLTMLNLQLGILGPLASTMFVRRAIRRMRFFYQKQLRWSRQVVEDVRNANGANDAGIYFVHPAFGPDNSIGASKSYLFEPSLIRESDWRKFLDDPVARQTMIEPRDPMMVQRRQASELLARRGFMDNIAATVASVGHPNEQGALRYAAMVVEKYFQRDAKHFSFSTTPTKKGASTPLLPRLEKLLPAAKRENGSSYPVTDLVVDFIEVTITTQDQPYSGTDHDIYFSVNQQRAWKLNESVFEGDLLDDFEEGITTTYSIDPFDYETGERLYLWEIQEIGLTLKFSLEALVTEPIGTWKPQRIKVVINGQEVLEEQIDQTLNYVTNKWRSSKFLKA